MILRFLRTSALLLALAFSTSVNATTYTVTNTLDNLSSGSLRWAINQSNAGSGTNTIAFNITGGTVPYTITLASALPDLTREVTIDGTTQPLGSYTGASPAVIIVGTMSMNYGLKVASGSSGYTIKGLGIHTFQLAGVYSAVASANISNNVIYDIGSTSTGHGIMIDNVASCVIKGNILGTNELGDAGLGCTGAGVLLTGTGATGCLVGSTTSGEGNISAFNNYGIAVANGDYNTISGNSVYGNTTKGIHLAGTGNDNITYPSVLTYSSGTVAGNFSTTAYPIVIEVFASNAPQNALQYLGTTTSYASGSSWSLSVGTGGWTNFVAVLIDANKNTSEISDQLQQVGSCTLSGGGFQTTPEIELLAPANFSTVDPSTVNLQYDINVVPALNPPVTASDYHLRLEIANEIVDPTTGIIGPDWTTAVGFDNTPVTPSTGTASLALNTYITGTSAPVTYYWRVGIQYQNPFAGHQPVLWSPVYKFIALTDPSVPASSYLTNNSLHTNDINWVYGVSYLDNGLTSEGIAYVDGLGKSRQVQSRVNTTNTVMAVEAAYSEEGGGVAMSLPAPVDNISNRFGYSFSFFDVFDSGSGDWSDFGTKDFDRNIKGSPNTLASPNAVDETLTGSVGNYYSSGGPEDYVDYAQGYPYAYNVPYNSPLKRPMLSAAGVGADFKMTSGKEYKHFYGNPSQEELDRLYGVDAAPDKDKISRSITYNPDGVGSISYTDNEGKLIATGLTVCSAPSLNALSEEGMTGFDVHINPLATDVMDPTTLVKTSTSKFFIPCSSTNVDINYTMDLGSFQVSPDVPCLNCKYDIDVTITNEATGEVIRHYSELNYAPTSPTCVGGVPESKTVVNETLVLDGPANYIVVRTIKPAAGLLEEMLESYETYLSANYSSLLSTFTTLYNTETNYYLLRQQKINSYTTTNSLCKLETSVFTGSTSGSANGMLTAATYNAPTGITAGTSGKYYIADAGNHTIRQVNHTGNVSVLAGSAGTSGSTDATGSSARFNSPYDVAFRHEVLLGSDMFARSVIVADKGNNKIRMVETATGVTTTIASSADGINAPEGVFVDDYGVIYVASTGSNEIYKIDLSSGSPVVTEIANSSTFNAPTDVAVTADGTLYITERGTYRVRKITSGGTVSVLYTFGATATPASIFPEAGGNLYVTDQANHKIYLVNVTTASATVIAGTGSSGSTDCSATLYTAPPTATFNNPIGLFASGARVFIADKNNNRIRIADLITCLDTVQKPEYLDYPDLVTVNDISTGGYTKDLTNLDGDEDGDGLIGDEAYKLTSMSVSSSLTSSSSEWLDFEAAYKRVNFIDLNPTGTSSSITSMDKYSIGSSSEIGTTTMPVFDENGLVDAGDLKNYYLLKVTFVKPSCAASCEGVDNTPSDCGDQCLEQQNALIADMNAAYTTAIVSSFPYHITSSITPVNLQYMITHFYPLNPYYLSLLLPADMTNYLDYQTKRMAYEVFDVAACTDLCNGISPGPCDVCASSYDACVEANISELNAQYTYFINHWDNPAANPNFPAFPFVLSDLIHGSGASAYPDVFWSNKLGLPFLNFLAANITSPTCTTRVNWNVFGGGCTNCAAPASSILSPSCSAGAPRDMSDFPSLLMTILQDKNDACLPDYEGCLQLNGTATQQNDYLCAQIQTTCIDALGPDPLSGPLKAGWDADLLACQNTYAACTTNTVHPTSVDLYRSDLIHEMLMTLYPLPSQAGTVATLQATIESATSGMTLSELELYLTNYGELQECIASCEQQLIDAFEQWLQEQKDNAANTINQAFITGCYGSSNEVLDISYPQNMYHYTLYNYDRANNLVSTVPPEGVDYIDLSAPAEYTASPRASRVPAHRMLTTYKPTSLYTITTSSPDEGSTRYLYDKAGRLRFSQTAEQVERGTGLGYVIFSYVKYDNEYRVIESGEYRDIPGNVCMWSQEDCPSGPCLCAWPDYSLESMLNSQNYPNTPSYTFEETYIDYDNSTLPTGIPSTDYAQTYLQGRVARTYNRDATTNLVSSASNYSYDAHGRVKFVVQTLPVFGMGLKKYKTVDYEYEGLTSRVDQIIYEKGNLQEEFRHKYTYDDDYRVINVEVSKDGGANWLAAAGYEYYLHGPLKNTELGNDIQSVDFVYNINGWLKAINNPLPTSYTNDAGEVASAGNVAPDVFSEVLNYYNGDYKRTGVGLDNSELTVPQSGTRLYGNAPDLFSGGISSTITSTAFDLTSMGSPPDNILAQGYKYDYLGRLNDVYAEVQPESFTSFRSTGLSTITDYTSHIEYDANGNITAFIRNTMDRVVSGSSTNSMDDMTYRYAQTTTDFRSNVKKTNNRLAHVNDAAVDEAGLDDIKDQDFGGGYVAGTLATHNYRYDAKGRIIADVKSGLTIEWTATDKVKKITKSDGTIISFTYDNKQQRLTKKVDPTGANNDVTTIYVYDASGILMSTYQYAYDGGSSAYKYSLSDHQVYGVGRIGTYKVDEILVTSPTLATNDPAKQFFEITDHLGSVRAVVSGVKTGTYNADIVQMTDYHEFGQTMQGRSFVSEFYRFGYQGSESDEEVNEGAYTTEFRMLDVRLGRWFMPDPLTNPPVSPYASMDNNPVCLTDVMGLSTGLPPGAVGSHMDMKGNVHYHYDNAPTAPDTYIPINYGQDAFGGKNVSYSLPWYKQLWNFISGNRYLNTASRIADENGTEIKSIMDGNILIIPHKDKEKNGYTAVIYPGLEDDGISITKITFQTLDEYFYEKIMQEFEGGGLTLLPLGSFSEEIEGEGIIANVEYAVQIKPKEARFFRLPKFRIRIGRGFRNVVYGRIRNGLPYVGKSFNLLKRYSAFERTRSGLRTIISGVTDKNLLRAIEQRMYNYLKYERGLNIDNKRNPMNSEDYLKYLDQVEEILKGFDWKKLLDDMFPH